MKTMRFALFLVALSFAVQAYAASQGTKKVEGVVTDQAGAPISGAEVTFADKAASVTRTTGADGRFAFDAQGDAAMLTIRARGFETASRVWKAADQDATRLRISTSGIVRSHKLHTAAALTSVRFLY